jgi:hypothetical protein
MLTKLKYVGVPTTDLLEIYILYIRSILEYCSTVWHSTVTVEQSRDIEKVQKVCLKIILGNDYEGYDTAPKVCGLDSLSDRRQQKCLHFVVIMARIDSYTDSAILSIQRLLNDYVWRQKNEQ